MKSTDIIFDSRNLQFKSPLGAVTAGTQISLRLLVSENLEPAAVKLILLYDRHHEPAYYDMHGSETPVETDGYLEFSCSMPIYDTGLYWYHFEVFTWDGRVLQVGKNVSDNRPVITDVPASWQQTVYDRKYEVPEWLCGGTFYHIFVDRFNSSGKNRKEMPGKILRDDWGGVPCWRPVNGKIYNNDFFGGDLEGIIQKLPYLADLGVTCLYLSPIFEAYSNHKYDTGDYGRIDPMFGTEEDFRRLCRTAMDEYGIHVILDGVFSHTGSDSVYFDKYYHYGGKGAYKNPYSPYRSWYYFRDDGSYECWWDFDILPRVNKTDPGYVEYITGENGIARKWLKAGASGWRLDVADELPNSFLIKLVKACKEEKKDALVVGEVWEDASKKIAYNERKNYFEGKLLDSVMNYPLRSGIIDFVRNGSARSLANTAEEIMENYPPEIVDCLMNNLSTHDSLRIITALAGEDLGPDPTREQQANTHLDEMGWIRGIRLQKIAVLLQMTLPGVPCIYYGDEAGTEGYKDPFNRTCYPWGHENQDLLSWYRKLLKLRSERKIFAHGKYRTIACSGGLYAFERYDPDAFACHSIFFQCPHPNKCNYYGLDHPDPSDVASGNIKRDRFTEYPSSYCIRALPSIITAANCGEDEEVFAIEGTWEDLLTGEMYSGNIAMFPGQVLMLEAR